MARSSNTTAPRAPRPRRGGPRPALCRAVLLAGVTVLGGAGRPVHAEPAPAPVDFVADLVARTFIRALFDGSPGELQPLLAERVSFDGQLLQGAAVQQRLAVIARRAAAQGRPRRIVLLPYAPMKARFGEAPARLRPLGLPGTVIALARLERGGLIVVLKRLGGRWKVVGLSD